MRYIDLTIPLKMGMRGVKTEASKRLEQDGWNASTFHLYSHCGTHMDAPLHFDVSDTSISDIPVERFFCDCWIIDCGNVEKRSLLTVDCLGSVQHCIRPGQGLLFRTGWHKHINQPTYRNALPRISKELAHWCVYHSVALIGVEPPSVADVNNLEELTQIHQILLKANTIVLEGLMNLDQIKAPKVQVIAFPLSMKGADGAPARVVALEEQQSELFTDL